MKRTKLAVFVLALVVLLVTAGLVFAAGGKEAGTAAKGNVPKRVGYVVNYSMHEWYQNLMKGMKERAAQLGIQLEIIDANLDMAKQVSAAEDLMAKGVDVLILSPVEQKGAEPILRKAEAEGIPVVIEASAVEGMKTLVAICDYDCGFKGGVETAKYFKANMSGKARILAVDL
ncbi:MAG: sugar ABC transporter substrate-binding protein, partial [Spirochaetales bacterium]